MTRLTIPTGAGGRQSGFSLIELMVSMVIGLVLTLAIAAVMVSSENDKRSSTGVNDVNQSGSYAAYVLDRQIRNAGSGYAQAWGTLVGCQISAQNGGQTVLPRAAFGTNSPFAAWGTTPIALAPVVVMQGAADTTTAANSDILLVTAGTGGFNEVPPSVLPGITSTGLRLPNTLGFRTGDLIVIADPAVAGKCIVEQVGNFSGGATSGNTGQALPFGGSYYHAVVGNVDVTTFGTSTSAYAAQIGNINANLPQFSLIGVGANSTLVSNDLLPSAVSGGTDFNPDVPIADGVIELRALYGTVPYPLVAGSAMTWVGAGTTGYAASDLLPANAGSLAAAQTRLHGIVAIRLGLILRTSIGEKTPVSAAPVTLFNGVVDGVSGASLTRTCLMCAAAGPPYYRYRTVEVTIPLPNVLAAP